MPRRNGRIPSAIARVAPLLLLIAAVPSPAAADGETYDGVVREHTSITSRFGQDLKARLGFPASGGTKATGPFPVVLDYTPYCDDPAGEPRVGAGGGPRSAPLEFVLAGYVVAVVNFPGTCGSEGHTEVFSWGVRASGYDVVEWLAAQPWSTGKVGMFGYSARGIAQLYTAALHPPHLVTIVPVSAYTDLYEDTLYRGGMPSGSELAQIHATLVGDWYGSHMAERLTDPESARATVENGWFAGEATAPPEFTTHPNKDAFWDAFRIDLDEIDIPVLSMGNFDDSFARGNVSLFTGAASDERMLTMGFNGHDIPGPGFDPIGQALRWFDHWLKEEANGIEHELEHARVNYYVRGEGVWRTANAWPPEGSAQLTFYLNGEPTVAGATGTLARTASAEPYAADVFVYEPAKGALNGQYGYVPTVRHDTYGQPDQRDILGYNDPTIGGEQRADAPGSLTYISEPLDEDTEVTGPALATLYASSTSEDTDWVVKILDVFPDQQIEGGPQQGYWGLVTSGWLKGIHRNGHVRPEPIPTGQVVEYQIEFYPSSYLFRAGHRIGVQISSADVARTIPNAHPAVNTVFRDQPRSSRLDVLAAPQGIFTT